MDTKLPIPTLTKNRANSVLLTNIKIKNLNIIMIIIKNAIFLNFIHNTSNLREADEQECVFVWI